MTNQTPAVDIVGTLHSDYAGRLGLIAERAADEITRLRAREAELQRKLDEAAKALADAAKWFEQYAVDHEVKARRASDSYERASRKNKAKRNQERADTLRAALSSIRGDG